MYDLSPNGERLFIVGVTCLSLSVAIVSLRIACKLLVKGGFHLDDFFIVIALMIYGAIFGVLVWGLIGGGGGAEMKDLIFAVSEEPDPTSFKKLETYLMSLWFSFALYLPLTTAIKISILFFYRRIFATQPYKMVSLVVMAFTTVWFLTTLIAYLFIAQPIDSFWDRRKPGKYLNVNILPLATGIVEIFIDLLILALPVSMVFQLRMSTRTKVVLASIFLLGGFVIVTGVVRVRYTYQPGTLYINFSNAELWSHIHIVTALLCACLPIYKPLLDLFSDYSTSLFSRYSLGFHSFMRGTSSGGSKMASAAGRSTPSYLRMPNIDEHRASDSDAHSDTSRKLSIYVKSDCTIKIEGGHWPGYQSDASQGPAPQGGIVCSRKVEIV